MSFLRKNIILQIISVSAGFVLGVYIGTITVKEHEKDTAAEEVVELLIVPVVQTIEEEPIEEQMEEQMEEVAPEEKKEYDNLELMAMCVEAEAGNQGLYGKQLVADVILNRVDDPDFPDTVEEVILQQNQFSVVLNGSIWEKVPTQETYDAIELELENRENTEILYFTSEGYICYGEPWKKIGDHWFSVKKGEDQ